MTHRSTPERVEERNLQDLMITIAVETARRFTSNVLLKIAIEPTDLRHQEEVLPQLQPEALVVPAEVRELEVLAEEEDLPEAVVVEANN